MREKENFSGYNMYDLDEIKAIPVRRVAESFGLKQTRNKNTFFAPGGERTGSLHLYDSNGQNRFYDFGRNVGGGPIELVAYICNLEWKEAVQELGQTFGLQPLGRETVDPYHISNWQWNKIGVYGDLATKNFDFSFQGHKAEERNEAISKKYAMNMNDLRKKYPGIYKSVLEKRAFSFVYACQQQYFQSLSIEYLSMQMSGFEHFDKMTSSGFENVKKIVEELIGCEKILKQAMKGTNLKFHFHHYDIEKDFQKIVSGEMKMEVGNVSSYDLRLDAKEKKIILENMELDFVTFEKIQNLNFTFDYSAVQVKDKVIISASEKDIVVFENIKKLLSYDFEMENEKKKELSAQIMGAKKIIGEKKAYTSFSKEYVREY